jgi:hypothetical protein
MMQLENDWEWRFSSHSKPLSQYLYTVHTGKRMDGISIFRSCEVWRCIVSGGRGLTSQVMQALFLTLEDRDSNVLRNVRHSCCNSLESYSFVCAVWHPRQQTVTRLCEKQWNKQQLWLFSNVTATYCTLSVLWNYTGRSNILWHYTDRSNILWH